MASNGTKTLTALRSSVRPVVTYADWALLIGLCVHGACNQLPMSGWIPPVIENLSYIINIFWFGDRLLQQGLSGIIKAKVGGPDKVQEPVAPAATG